MGVRRPQVIGITGAKGFIGSYLVERLQQENIPHVIFQGNLLREEDIESFFEKNNISTVIHLVGAMNQQFSELLQTNILTTQNLLEIGVTHSLQKIIFTSSGAVYGGRTMIHAKETDAPEPVSLYGLSKKFAEEVIHLYEKEHGLVGIILRFPNVYGSGNNKNVIAKMIDSIKKEKRVYVAGDGKQRRQFLHVDDAAKAIMLSLKLKKSEVINITNEKDEYSINELVHLLKKYFSFTIKKTPADNNLKNLLMKGRYAEKVLRFKAKKNLPDFLTSLL